MRVLKYFLLILFVASQTYCISQNYVRYRINGKKKYEVIFLDNDTTNVIFYNFFGHKTIDASYYKDTLNGKSVEWYNKKKIKHIGYYKNGQPNGKWKYWYKNGKIKSQIFFVNNRRDDWWTHWYDNGNIKEKAYYINGVLEGPWKKWYKNGKLQEEGNCKNGQKDGLWIEYYINGNKKRETYYEEGTAVTQPIFWWSNGKLDYPSKRELERIKALPENERTKPEKIILKRNMHYFRLGSYGF